jgi:alpha-beta hydrolase superfamily lysophospholipase
MIPAGARADQGFSPVKKVNLLNKKLFFRILGQFLFASFFFLWLAAASRAYSQNAGVPGTDTIRALAGGLQDLSFSHPAAESALWKTYLDYYGFSPGGKESFYAGSVLSGSCRIAVFAFLRNPSRGTVFLVHGYFDHTGLLAPLIDYLTGENYSVISIDLPGHGLSGGDRASIQSIGEYGDSVRAAVDACRAYASRPFYAVGHSTGAAAVLEYLYAGGDKTFDKIVFMAPLVRSALWYPSKAAHFISRGWLNSTKRWYRNSSSNRSFRAFQKADPLGCATFPLSWSTALFSWEKRVASYPAMSLPVLIIQGTEDNVVDFSHNVPLLEKMLSARTEYIEGANHLLVNEIPPYRDRVFASIESFFSLND